MTDTEILERLAQAEHKIRGFEELTFAFGDVLNARTNRYDSEFAEIRTRLNLIDRAVTMLQTDVRDLRSGVTAQLIAQDRRIAELASKVGALEERVGAIETTTQELAAGMREMDARQRAMDGKLDAIVAKLGA